MELLKVWAVNPRKLSDWWHRRESVLKRFRETGAEEQGKFETKFGRWRKRGCNFKLQKMMTITSFVLSSQLPSSEQGKKRGRRETTKEITRPMKSPFSKQNVLQGCPCVGSLYGPKVQSGFALYVTCCSCRLAPMLRNTHQKNKLESGLLPSLYNEQYVLVSLCKTFTMWKTKTYIYF